MTNYYGTGPSSADSSNESSILAHETDEDGVGSILASAAEDSTNREVSTNLEDVHFHPDQIPSHSTKLNQDSLDGYSMFRPSQLYHNSHDPSYVQEQGHRPSQLQFGTNLASHPSLFSSSILSPSSALASAPPPAKIGTRFSRDSVRILKAWFASHTQHPFATDEESHLLQTQTGLSKSQIAIWLSNARRRAKPVRPMSFGGISTTSPHSSIIAIPIRPGTPATRDMNPLERWVDSSSDNEPVSTSTITQAMDSDFRSLSGAENPFDFGNVQDRPQTPLSQASSVASFGTSQSSACSTYSHENNSSVSTSLKEKGPNRRRKKRTTKQPADSRTSLLTIRHTYQCTFCTETFKTKHNWQRHEISLHLPLQRWVCAPNGPRQFNLGQSTICVFCGQLEPDDAHIEGHNYSICQDRALSERTFTRKDHLRQHLRLVHNVKPAKLHGPLESWKTSAPPIRSICGFCGITMESWDHRVDHLADHFKMGSTMLDWKGDWGFDSELLSCLENSIPPYLIQTEQNSPFPFMASGAPSEARNAYELLELELAHSIQMHYDTHLKPPNSTQIKLEACRIIFASEALSEQEVDGVSWLRDLIMSEENITRAAQLGPLRSGAESRLPVPRIFGQATLFESCPLEAQLQRFVKGTAAPMHLQDSELQEEASCSIQRAWDQSISPVPFVAKWLIETIWSSSSWLDSFRVRAHLPSTSDHEKDNGSGMNLDLASDGPLSNSDRIDAILENYRELENRLSEYVELLSAHGITPDDSNLHRQVRNIIAGFEDEEWKMVAINNQSWFISFKRRYVHSSWTSPQAGPSMGSSMENRVAETESNAAIQLLHKPPDLEISTTMHRTPDHGPMDDMALGRALAMARTGLFYPHNSNIQRWVGLELARWVRAAMSPKNPSPHSPTDEELQHQARWILYDE